MRVLGIESSCDESAAAVVQDGTTVLSSVVFSQVPLHVPYGGVVPEIASRSHIEKVPGVIRQAMVEAFGSDDATAWHQVDAIAATCGPGLASSLIVGWSAAKGLALSLHKPLIAVNHLQAHLHSVLLERPELQTPDLFPQLALAVSGGHTSFIYRPDFATYTLIGQTLDDAAGEALDKAAKLLGLGYPGGPTIDKRARAAADRRHAITFPKGRISADHPLPPGFLPELCVSFSGLKTSLMYHLQSHPVTNDADIDTLCASYQEAVIDALISRLELAATRYPVKSLAIGGGVSLNSRLRERATELAARHGIQLLLALPKYCGDNAAMIAGFASAGGGSTATDNLARDVDPSLPVDAQ